MKLVKSHYLADGKLYNHGQETTLIQVEAPDDYETLLHNIFSTGYYDRTYFESHSGLRDDRKVPHFWAMAQMLRTLRPRAVLDVGCGRGDVLSLLEPHGVRVTGIDFSEDVRSAAWPNVREHYLAGDFAERCQELAREGRRFDTLCAFDIWEHLLPRRLHEYISALVSVASEDALFVFVVPAFGTDRVFGEQFPLEVEENRARFDAREPFAFLCAERLEPPIPASGHLIWAHTQWWERQFAQHGLERLTDVERRLHAVFDLLFPHSVRSFYVFCRDPRAVQPRTRHLLPGPALIHRARLLQFMAEDIRARRITLSGEGRELLRKTASTLAPVPVKRAWRTLRGFVRKG
ncbi:class I SAM-dependent methyltransferase [Archangium violaceum]|uniref:class I SAM-dependent methyltransferase n=1 Tax=Archangium violaceum TaxID=83451 RepID=UPI0036DBF679